LLDFTPLLDGAVKVLCFIVVMFGLLRYLNRERTEGVAIIASSIAFFILYHVVT
jgi:hypothetical protein